MVFERGVPARSARILQAREYYLHYSLTPLNHTTQSHSNTDTSHREKDSWRVYVQCKLKEFDTGHWTDDALPGSRPAEYISHSILGLVAVYNRLPAAIVAGANSASSLRYALQELLIRERMGPDFQPSGTVESISTNDGA